MRENSKLYGKGQFVFAIIIGALINIVGESTVLAVYLLQFVMQLTVESFTAYLIIGYFLLAGGLAIVAAAIYGLIKAIRYNKAILRLDKV